MVELGLWLRRLSIAAGTLAIACGTDADDSAGASQLTYCDAQPILANKCVRCHSDPPRNGAPFSLQEYADTQITTDNGEHRYERMREAIESDFMPYRGIMLDPPVEPLTCEERATLLDWLGHGAAAAPADDPDCTQSAPALLACSADP